MPIGFPGDSKFTRIRLIALGASYKIYPMALNGKCMRRLLARLLLWYCWGCNIYTLSAKGVTIINGVYTMLAVVTTW